jgi:hypothetical protein
MNQFALACAECGWSKIKTFGELASQSYALKVARLIHTENQPNCKGDPTASAVAS